jgi:hypothetical protein
VAVLMFPALAGARELLVPGVTYQRTKIFNGGRPVVLHVVRTPPPSDLYRLRPVRAGGEDVRRQTVPAMQHRLSRRATTVGINGDFFKLESGQPSGVFLRNGVLSARPSQWRSGMAVGLDGRLLVDLFGFDATWRTDTGNPREIRDLNRQSGTSHVLGSSRAAGEAARRGRAAHWSSCFPASRGRDSTGI